MNTEIDVFVIDNVTSVMVDPDIKLFRGETNILFPTFSTCD